MLEADALTYGYQRREPVLREVSLAAEAGRVLVILGPNGAGKTTLLRLLAGLASPWSGEARLAGARTDRLTPGRRAARVAYVAQRPSVASAFTVREVVALGRHAVGPDDGAIERALEAVAMRESDSEIFWRLSAGQQQRVSIARALAQLDGVEGGVVIADEPLAALDPRHAQRVLDALRSVVGSGGAVCVVMHDLTTAARFADDVVILGADGRVAAAGEAAVTLRPDTLERVFGAPFERIDASGGPAILPRPLAPSDDAGR